jgi:hypothetical protein
MGSVGILSLPHRVRTGSGAHPASYAIGIGSSYSGVKWPGREADHLSPSSVEVKEYLHSPISLNGVVLS